MISFDTYHVIFQDKESCSSNREQLHSVMDQQDGSLSRRAEVFRTRLIEEFQLLDSLSEQGRIKAPVYSTSNVIDGI